MTSKVAKYNDTCTIKYMAKLEHGQLGLRWMRHKQKIDLTSSEIEYFLRHEGMAHELQLQIHR